MSADERESSMTSSLASGATLYIVKPVDIDDFKNVWQFVIASTKGKSSMMEKMRSIVHVGSSAETERIPEEVVGCNSLMSEGHSTNKTYNKRKFSDREECGLERQATALKKDKVVWTAPLQNLFLQAINQLTLESKFLIRT